MTSQQPRPYKRAGIAAAALIGVLAVGTAVVPMGPHATATAEQVTKATPMTTAMLPADFTEVIERVSPAVVNIQVTEKAQQSAEAPSMPRGMEEFFKRFFGDQLPEGFGFGFPGPRGESPRGGPAVKGIGSGFIIDPEGYIVTNNHVAGDATEIIVTLQDGKTYPGKLVGKDPETDLALVKIEADHPLPFVKFSTEPTPRPGQWVIAVGNPFGLDHTATAGIVSATSRAIGSGPYDDFIQIDAPINRGNSGGPTFNLKGDVVGVNTAIYSPSGGSVGIGFAIPASSARNVIEQLRENGKVERGWLGVEIQGVTPEIAQSLGLDSPMGALVAKVMPDGPAAAAGLKQGDLVTAVNDRKVAKVGDLSRYIADVKPGSKVELTLRRNGEEQTVSLEVGRRPAAEQLASSARPGKGDQGGDTVLGMRLATVDKAARDSFGLGPDVTGAVITDVASDSAAAERGLSPGDVIVSVANQRVRSAADVSRRIAEAKKSGKKAVLMLVRKEGNERFVALPVG